jgi:cysteine synthase A
MAISREWVDSAMRKIDADFNRSSDTHLFRLDVPGVPGVPLYLKDESIHPTGSLKHRLARSLFLYAICNGWVGPKTTVVEASSGSTAISEAYFARLLGLPFVAVIPKPTSPEKIAQIEFYGGHVHLVDDPAAIYDESRRLAHEAGGHFMDQFTYAERVTDWRGNNNIADTIFEQMAREEHPVPSWIVCGAGTGGTSATIGRYTRYRSFDTRLCVVDQGPRRRLVCCPALSGTDFGSQVWRLHRDQHLWRRPDHGAHGCRGRKRFGSDSDLRPGRALSRHLLQ